MFHSALPALTATTMLEMSTRQLTARAATVAHGSFPSLNYRTSDLLSQGKKKPLLFIT